MYAPVEDKHAPDPRCCGCGLKPRCLGNDLLRLIIIVLLLLPLILLLSGCDKRRGFGDTPSVSFAGGVTACPNPLDTRRVAALALGGRP